jgi:hypothetical protein
VIWEWRSPEGSKIAAWRFFDIHWHNIEGALKSQVHKLGVVDLRRISHEQGHGRSKFPPVPKRSLAGFEEQHAF